MLSKGLPPDAPRVDGFDSEWRSAALAPSFAGVCLAFNAYSTHSFVVGPNKLESGKWLNFSSLCDIDRQAKWCTASVRDFNFDPVRSSCPGLAASAEADALRCASTPDVLCSSALAQHVGPSRSTLIEIESKPKRRPSDNAGPLRHFAHASRDHASNTILARAKRCHELRSAGPPLTKEPSLQWISHRSSSPS